MYSRERLSAKYQGRSIQASGTMRHGPLPGSIPSDHRQLDRLSHPEILENKIASQAAEIDRLSSDNRKLAASHVALREELISAEHEVQGLKVHIRSIEAESDIQIRVVLEKIAKMEGIIKNSENVKRELQRVHIEAQSLVNERQELGSKIHLASEELKKARADVESLPELVAELESLRKEHKRLWVTFEHEKSVNIEQVEKLKAMERNLIGMVKEIEALRVEIVNAENKAIVHAPCQHPLGYANGTCFDEYGRPLVQQGTGPKADGTIPVVISDDGNPVWAGAYDPSYVER